MSEDKITDQSRSVNTNPLPERNENNSYFIGLGLSRVIVLALFFGGLFVLALGLGLFFFRGQSSPDDIQIISTGSNQEVGQIVVHIDGAVEDPGVYRLSADSRVSDAVIRAGGFSKEADTAKVNLAAKLTDGQKIHVFAIGEQVTRDKGQGTSVSSGLININTASEADLDKLPGIGPVTAGKIIASRPYSTPEELLSRKVVSGSVYEKIKELITVY